MTRRRTRHGIVTLGVAILSFHTTAALADEGVPAPKTPPAAAPTGGAPQEASGAPSPDAKAEPSTPPGADAKARPEPTEPLVHHRPVMSAVQSRDLRVVVGVDAPHLAKRILLVYRARDGKAREVELRRDEIGYGGVIPAAEVTEGLAYCLELETTDGVRVEAFASRGAMHGVQTLAEAMDEHEARLLKRLGGRRSVVSVAGEYADFGPDDAGANDHFWRVEGKYVYRPLRTVAEFAIRGGVLRGEAGGVDEVGLNYGAPSVRFRVNDLWHLELEGMASISDEGFSAGGGIHTLIGDAYGSKLVLGLDFVGVSDERYFGTRFFSRVDLATHERVTVSPVIEITDMPNAELWGVRLLADVAVHFDGGLSLSALGGYQARISEGGGPSVGGQAALAF